MTTDYTKIPAEERELTMQEKLLIKHMENISYAQRLEKQVKFLQDRLTKVELELEDLKTNNTWLEYNEQSEELTHTDKFFR